MITRPSPPATAPSTKSTVGLPIILMAIFLLVALVGGLAWHYLGPQGSASSGRTLTAEEQANARWIKQKARESGGNFDKLSQEDQRRMLSISGARAPLDLRQAAHPVRVGN